MQVIDKIRNFITPKKNKNKVLIKSKFGLPAVRVCGVVLADGGTATAGGSLQTGAAAGVAATLAAGGSNLAAGANNLANTTLPTFMPKTDQIEEIYVLNNEDAKDKLSKIADYFILHNRDIVNRVDDSVVRVIDNKIQTLRRARGYAPAPIILPPGFEKIPPILAMGSELKNTFCLLREGEAILSQHLGDLENASAFNAYQETLNLYLNLFQHKPEIIAIDKHPEYLSSKLGKELAKVNNIKLAEIQHHHAHIAACMAENQISLDTKPILGIAFDGLGYGEI